VPVGEVADGPSVGVPDGDEVPERLVLGVWLGVAVFDVDLSLGLAEWVVRLGRGALGSEVVAAGVDVPVTGAGGGRTSR
jgi:hypothetical protein